MESSINQFLVSKGVPNFRSEYRAMSFGTTGILRQVLFHFALRVLVV
jgi:hypothetical protein